jgi:hypothetical protein
MLAHAHAWLICMVNMPHTQTFTVLLLSAACVTILQVTGHVNFGEHTEPITVSVCLDQGCGKKVSLAGTKDPSRVALTCKCKQLNAVSAWITATFAQGFNSGVNATPSSRLVSVRTHTFATCNQNSNTCLKKSQALQSSTCTHIHTNTHTHTHYRPKQMQRRACTLGIQATTTGQLLR